MKKTFTPLTSLLCLALAATAHPNNPQKIKRAAKQAMLRMPKHQRGMFAPVLASARPAHVIWGALEELTVKPRCQVAFDLETLGTSPDSKILSVGAVAVCEGTGQRRRFYSICNANAQPGRTVSRSTLDWWSKQSDAARAAFDEAYKQEAPMLVNVLNDLTQWVGDLGLTHDVFVHGNGANFDVAMLEHAYKQVSDFVPWNFRHVRDMRTLRDICLRLGLEPAIKASVQRVGVHHNALDDAEYQANIVIESLRQLDILKQFIDESEAFADPSAAQGAAVV